MPKTSKPSSIARKIRIGAYVVMGFLVLALVVPFLVDFSSFKPQIQAVTSQNLNAKVDFESARLQLIPSIGIKLKGVTVENTDPVFNGTKLFSVDSLLVNAKLFALLTGKVVGRIEIDAPVFVIAKAGLKSNITSLMKPAASNSTGSVDQGSTSSANTKGASEPISDPNNPSAIEPAGSPDPKAQADDAAKAMAETMATVKEKFLIEGVYINGANITIRDLASSEANGAQVSAEPVRVRDLNIAITNIGLDRDIKIRMDTKIDVNEAGTSIKGPISVDKTVHVTMGGNGLEKATFVGKLSYDELLINYRNVFVKNPGIPLNVAFSGVFAPNDFNLETLVFNMHNLKVEAKAQVLNFADPKLDADVKVANENLASLGDLLPQHKDLLVNGQLHLGAGVHGAISSLSTLEAKVDFDTKLAGTDLDIHMNTKGVFPFKGKLAVNSKRIDLDSLIGPFQKKSGESSTSQQPSNSPATDGKGSTPPGPAVDIDASATAPKSLPVAELNTPANDSKGSKPATDFALTSEQKQAIQGTDGEVRVNLREVNYTSQKLTNIIIDLDQKNLIGALKQFNIDGFGGKISASGKVDLAPAPISFAIDFKMLEIHPEKVTAAIKPENKDLLVGRMNLDLAVTGAGTTVPTLNKTLNGKGSFHFLDGELHTKSIGSAMGEEFDQYLTTLSAGGAGQAIFDAAEKLLNSPLAKALGKSPPDIAKMKEQYQSSGKMKLTDKSSANKSLKDVNGKIEIKDGRVYVVSTTTDSSGTMNFNSFFDLELKLGGTSVYTASPATIERLKSQSKYADLLLDDKNNLTIAMTLGGTVLEPKVTIGSTAMRETFTNKAKILIEKEVKAAAEAYLNSLMGGGAQKAEAAKKVDEVKAKAAEQVNSPENKKKAGSALKGLFGK